jgi:CDP-diacylglycerol--serine O-phosphatidyltransferase
MALNRGIFPGTFTMGNAVCGFLSILSAFEDKVVEACWFVILAGFLDALDGKVARLSRTSSQFGVELDSLADFLSFGVAPAVIVHSIKLSALGKWGWIISVVYIMATAYRLARFNLMAEEEEKKDFLGLPVPAAAFGLVSYIIMSYHLWGGLRYDDPLVSMIVLFAFLMVSQVQYDTLPDRFQTGFDRIKAVYLLVGLGLLLLTIIINTKLFNYRVLLFPFVAMYILFGVIREFYRLFSVGVGKVTGRPSNRRSQEKEESHVGN